MQYKTTTVDANPTTDQGEFSAIAAAWTTDRQNERIVPGAFASTISYWQQSGKSIPLHWNHESGAEAIIGTVDPFSMAETDQGLHVAGEMDINDSKMAREAWRSVKRNRVGLSFGFLTTDQRKGADGVTELTSLDLYEISLTPSPANQDTRILSTKAADNGDRDRHRDEMLRILADGDPEFAQREKASQLGVDELARQGQPVRVESFGC
ncbi:MAG: HK97 family phage prohead protease [Actinomycetota bacterium]